nr:immunoglobulin light chain junction region [Macaca mulatta]
CQQGFDPPFTF